MNSILGHWLRFRGVPESTAFFLLSVMIVLPIISSATIQTDNEIANPSLNKSRINGQVSKLGAPEAFQGTFSVCSRPPVVVPDLLMEIDYYTFSLIGVMPASLDMWWNLFMRQFQTYLELSGSVSRHTAAVQLNNRSVAELQDALTYAWLPMFERSNRTAVRAEILRIENGTMFSSNGSPVALITYMLPISDEFNSSDVSHDFFLVDVDEVYPSNSSRNLPRDPWLYPWNDFAETGSSFTSDITQRLQEKGLTAYDGPLFYQSGGILDDIYLRANLTYGLFDTDGLKADVLGIVEQKRIRQNCNDTGMTDVEVHFGQLEPAIVPSRTNGKFSDVTVMPLPFVVKVQEKTLISDTLYWFTLPNHTHRYYVSSETAYGRKINTTGLHLVDQPPLNPTRSFRMHLDRPLNIQRLPLLEALMTSHLNNLSIGAHNRAEVRIWDFDPDGWVVNFFVVLHYEPQRLSPWKGFVLDARLPYTATIYRKLNGLELRLPPTSTVYRLMTASVDEYSKNTMKASILRECEENDKWLSLPSEAPACPLKKNFTLYVEWQSERPQSRDLVNGSTMELPDSDKILDAVQQAFAAANPVTMDNITLTIIMTERNDSLHTATERDSAKINFAVSYPKMKSGLYWNLWRYPSLHELNAALQSIAGANVVFLPGANHGIHERIQYSIVGARETFPGAFSVCPTASESDLLKNLSYFTNRLFSRVMWNRNLDLSFNNFMSQFQSYLELQGVMGRHTAALQLNNRSVAELQDALIYAWLPMFERGNRTAVRAEILRIENGTIFSSNGSPLSLITYMLPASDEEEPSDSDEYPLSSSRNLPRDSWLFAWNDLAETNSSFINEFIQRLQEKGLTAYDGPLFYQSGGILDDIYLRANSAYGLFDADQLKADVLAIVEQMRISQNCSGAGMDAVEVHFGKLEPGIVTSRTNGKFSDVTVTPIPFVVKLQQKILISELVSWFPLPNHTDRYSFYSEAVYRKKINTTGLILVDQLPLNPARSFRMYLDRPLNVQWLPQLEALMTSHLNNLNIGTDNRAEVRLWNFDPDGWVVNFFVILYYEPVRPTIWKGFVLDARLPYTATIYRKLNGLELRSPPTGKVYRLVTDNVGDDAKNTMEASILRNAKELAFGFIYRAKYRCVP
ncbi:uncharacterized protein LOC129592993 [Paramacrobiotus metropolitanus]|uniref:uncharacterized protein LOC129592993 n=1 Tax=Paramacrobiotus metropolitanus TaxID=2943436 RepID=UPI002445D919|nr:uncharacterized protein LOC129592993 [Paramacrobiotus metropolitanus]